MKTDKRVARIRELIRRLEEGSSVSLGSLKRVLTTIQLSKYLGSELQPSDRSITLKCQRRSLKLAILSIALEETRGVAIDSP
jgi:hypothetical protein